jgi:hypothetical protein
MKWALLAALLALTGCTSHACSPEGLPRRGAVERPGDLLPLAKHAVQHDCTGLLYDLLSEATQDEYSYVTFWAFWQTDYADQVRQAIGGKLKGKPTRDRRRDDSWWLRVVFLRGGQLRQLDLLAVPAPSGDDPDPDEPVVRYRLGLKEQGLLDE